MKSKAIRLRRKYLIGKLYIFFFHSIDYNAHKFFFFFFKKKKEVDTLTELSLPLGTILFVV